MSLALPLDPGTVVATDYRVEEQIARGGMGTLYRVTQLSTGADRDPQALLIASLVSYAIRVSVPTVMLIALQANASRVSFDRNAVALTTVAVVLGWLALEVATFQRLRIPVFDEPEPPSHPGV